MLQNDTSPGELLDHSPRCQEGDSSPSEGSKIDDQSQHSVGCPERPERRGLENILISPEPKISKP